MSEKNKSDNFVKSFLENYTFLDFIEHLIFCILIISSYYIGFNDGKIDFCLDKDLILIKDPQKGIEQCWTEFQYEEYKKQWETNGGIGFNGNQYNPISDGE